MRVPHVKVDSHKTRGTRNCKMYERPQTREQAESAYLDVSVEAALYSLIGGGAFC
jgi:hypothetical protein